MDIKEYKGYKIPDLGDIQFAIALDSITDKPLLVEELILNHKDGHKWNTGLKTRDLVERFQSEEEWNLYITGVIDRKEQEKNDRNHSRKP